MLESLSVVYQDPYATDDGVARTTSLTYSKYDTADTALISYLSNKTAAGMSYQIPVSEFSAFQVGASLSKNEIIQTIDSSVLEINEFIDNYGKQHDQLSIPVAYIFDTRNRTIFPDSGTRQVFSLSYEAAGSDLAYQQFHHTADYYWPSIFDTTLHIRYELAYGAGRDGLKELPFYEKYSTGGNNSVHGFEPRSLGPKATQILSDGTTYTSDVTLGGDFLTEGSVELVIMPFKKAAGTTRFVLFYDFGNAFDTYHDFATDELRTSFGLAIKWLAPVGAMTFSYAEPIHYQKSALNEGIYGDKIKRFQFDVGGSF